MTTFPDIAERLEERWPNLAVNLKSSSVIMGFHSFPMALVTVAGRPGGWQVSTPGDGRAVFVTSLDDCEAAVAGIIAVYAEALLDEK